MFFLSHASKLVMYDFLYKEKNDACITFFLERLVSGQYAFLEPLHLGNKPHSMFVVVYLSSLSRVKPLSLIMVVNFKFVIIQFSLT